MLTGITALTCSASLLPCTAGGWLRPAGHAALPLACALGVRHNCECWWAPPHELPQGDEAASHWGPVGQPVPSSSPPQPHVPLQAAASEPLQAAASDCPTPGWPPCSPSLPPPPVAPQVFKAHITTSPSGQVSDMFWLFDNRNELPENHRCAERASSCVQLAKLQVCSPASGLPTSAAHCASWDPAARTAQGLTQHGE